MEKLKANDILDLISKQWASRDDVKAIGSVGYNKSLKIMQEIKESASNKGYKLPKNLVPMEMVVEYFKININYLKKVRDKSL